MPPRPAEGGLPPGAHCTSPADGKWGGFGGAQGNQARLINHSCAPNCKTRVVQDRLACAPRIAITTLVPISKGQELFYDYKFEYEDGKEAVPCHCGAATCRGRMN